MNVFLRNTDSRQNRQANVNRLFGWLGWVWVDEMDHGQLWGTEVGIHEQCSLINRRVWGIPAKPRYGGFKCGYSFKTHCYFIARYTFPQVIALMLSRFTWARHVNLAQITCCCMYKIAGIIRGKKTNVFMRKTSCRRVRPSPSAAAAVQRCGIFRWSGLCEP